MESPGALAAHATPAAFFGVEVVLPRGAGNDLAPLGNAKTFTI